MTQVAEETAHMPKAAADLVSRVEAFTQRISRKTEFLFVRVSLKSGAQGWGEATFNALNGQVLVALRMLAQGIEEEPLPNARSFLEGQPCWKHGRAFRVAVNALETAILDAEARRQDAPLNALLGERRQSAVKCYANINRGTIDRTPDGWAARAKSALQAGHGSVKIAPFDEVEGGESADRLRAAQSGVDALLSVRDGIGDGADVLLDCHWRFDERSAIGLIGEIAEAGPKWIEAPILEDYEALSSLRSIRTEANRHGIDLAGGELHSGYRGWAPILRGNVYDTANPDLRFCGPTGMIRIAEAAARYGTGFAPHNHLGPVMTAASLHAMSVAATARELELQHGESDVGSCLTDPSVLEPDQGELSVPKTAGLGISMNTRALERVPLG